ncbi:RHS repeat-associated core domain-containing protein [Candidatus Rhabdochlamydia sp. T3358]|uniref:RHS repeat domain-containing protein n=1 Tax=Candidatus Rhabdochlamydia sp. T3358 TaxID=2099795 RepID=UPI0014850591|nr:RHS repeat-associated core domain-containing protein [Candidatus Rhabdochlamydia sp. T3358]
MQNRRKKRQFEWDPWGRLLKVTDKAFTWEASYDALGRRLQTRYTPYKSATLTTTSLYDPEEEFQEIGVKCQDKTFWKIYGPNSCDAISDESEAVFLIHNALGQLAGVVTEQQTRYTENFPSAYGPTDFSIPSDLLSYAQSLTWHSKSPDPTNLIWMGERYYDATSGRFLSPDPISYPLCLDLYTYANGDPINYIDPDGRFASYAYQTVKPLLYPCQPGMTVMNGVFAVCANIGLTRSSPFEVGSFNLSTGAIGFINGINNNKIQARLSAQQLSQYAQGTKIYGTHNATNFPVIDVFECAAGHIGFHTPPVQLLKNKWKHLIASHGPQAKFLEICHSGGAIHLKNALLTSPESVRQQIIALAIAPAVIIPRRLCFQSDNYISKNDFVTHLDFDGKRRYGNELHVLEPHPDAKDWDHEFLSPTFESRIQGHIKEYLKNYGGKR